MPYKDPEKQKEYMKEWRLNHPEEVKTTRHNWYENNSEYYHSDIIKENNERRRQANRERYIKLVRAWDKAHPDKKNARNAKRRAQKLQATPIWADHEIIGAFYKIAHTFDLVVDHIIPLQNKDVCGLHVHHNLQLLTRSDNCKKGNRLLEQFS